MTWKFIFVLMILCLSISCSKKAVSSADQKEIVISDGYTDSENISRNKEPGEDKKILPVSENFGTETNKTLDDSSRVMVFTNRYGTKIETRSFNMDPKLLQIVLRTTADGKREVFVYGQNGDIKSVPDDMVDKLMTASSDQIASAAGINAVSTVSSAYSSPGQAPLQPLPSSNFPIATRQPGENSGAVVEEANPPSKNKTNE